MYAYYIARRDISCPKDLIEHFIRRTQNRRLKKFTDKTATLEFFYGFSVPPSSLSSCTVKSYLCPLAFTCLGLTHLYICVCASDM